MSFSLADRLMICQSFILFHSTMFNFNLILDNLKWFGCNLKYSGPISTQCENVIYKAKLLTFYW